MGNQIRIADKKTKTTNKNTKMEHENISGRNRESTIKTKSTTRRD